MVKRLKYIWHAYNLALQKRPFLTQICTAGTLYATGDALCQAITIRGENAKNHSENATTSTTSTKHHSLAEQQHHHLDKLKYDIWRTLRFGFYGLTISGPLSYVWYKALDRFIKVPVGATRLQAVRISCKKVLWDELTFGPATLAIFFTAMSLLEGKTVQQSIDKCKSEFLTTLIIDLVVWSGAQFVNFLFLPTHYRILYISTLNLFWNAFLSNMQHQGLDHDVVLQKLGLSAFISHQNNDGSGSAVLDNKSSGGDEKVSMGVERSTAGTSAAAASLLLQQKADITEHEVNRVD